MAGSNWLTEPINTVFNKASISSKVKLHFHGNGQVRLPVEAFVSPFSISIKAGYVCSTGFMERLRSQRTYHVAVTQKSRIMSNLEANENHKEEVPRGEGEQGSQERRFRYKFDPTSDTDAFGRDPRKETEFWMGAAKSVLESSEVQQALAEHAAEGGDGLTDEQREYMEFIKSLDQDKE
ncbi:unnamed protein product [Agarophyton chilense]|eukprot:gb/GEZJ01001909.1/.p1 GENE.gb/GEZJ01001909.1/~~gb/GEZJ01001909.1/.p1  ORF type:complete len:179 (-),score=25.20 gb/GEZJ01001909.1/:499-1035(-)